MPGPCRSDTRQRHADDRHPEPLNPWMTVIILSEWPVGSLVPARPLRTPSSSPAPSAIVTDAG